jgi:glycosyltransferase involved in cell wall biosynthesis
MKPRLIWIAGTNLESELGAATWIETTHALVRLGWDVTLLSEGFTGWRTIRGEKVYGLPRSEFYFLGSLAVNLLLLRYIVRNRGSIDLILFHQMTAIWIFLLKFLFWLIGWKFPLAVLDSRDIPKYGQGMKHRLREIYFKLVHGLANRLSIGQTAITSIMADHLKIPPSKLLGIWPSGVTPRIFQGAALRRNWPSKNEPVRLIYIGTLRFERNLNQLCRAVIRANQLGMAFRMVVLGDGPARRSLQEIAVRSEGDIVVEGSVPHVEIPMFLEKAHVGVTPLPASNDRMFAISSPIKMFEYMASGLAVLTTSNICHTNVVGDGNYAFWAEEGTEEDLFKSLQVIWENRLMLSAMGKGAGIAAQDWTWDAAAKKLSNALVLGLRKNSSEEVILDLKEAEH